MSPVDITPEGSVSPVYRDDEVIIAPEVGIVAPTAQQVENKSNTELNLEADKILMQAIKDQPNADLRADPSQEIKDIAVAVRRLINMALADFDEVD